MALLERYSAQASSETSGGGGLRRVEAANPAFIQEFTLCPPLSDTIPARAHHFRRYLLSIPWDGFN
ncbi:hypothetical protein DOE73_20250 [Paenibacillus dendritiformis]|nr:hypothetical protein DOE73_20250 [Paenibacillus dendritiformis]